VNVGNRECSTRNSPHGDREMNGIIQDQKTSSQPQSQSLDAARARGRISAKEKSIIARQILVDRSFLQTNSDEREYAHCGINEY